MAGMTQLGSKTAIDAILDRRTVRRFSQRDVEDKVLYELLDLANRAPSSYNLQPWHFVVIRDANLKSVLEYVTLGQHQVTEAPATVVFVADPKAWRLPYDRLLKMSSEAKVFTPEKVAFNRRMVSRLYRTGPLGLYGLYKRIVVPLKRLKQPMANVLNSFEEAQWHARCQTMLAAATFMIAARAYGLDTNPMERFDEYRLKKMLDIPKYMSIPIAIAIGYALDVEGITRTLRFPLNDKVSIDRFRKRETS
ncbi:MAG: nitroreductase family protein [Deltaproteobacteria bacterium]|nr:nitroreductase family protein [Deltaproteobacteria bacterium]